MRLIATFCVCFLVLAALASVLTHRRAVLSRTTRAVCAALASFSLLLAAVWFTPNPWTMFTVGVAVAAASMALRGEGLSGITSSLGRWRFGVYLLSVATLSALIYLFVPITTYLTSPGELDLKLDYLLANNTGDAMKVVYVAALTYALAFTPRMRTALAVVALAMLAAGLIYSYVLPLGYPMMTGLAFEQIAISPFDLSVRVLADLIVLALLVVSLHASLVRFGGKPFVVGIVLINASLCIAAGVGIRKDAVGGAGGPSDEARLSEQPLQFSKTQPNVLVILLDRFMGSYVESILASDPELADEMKGFTWYPRTVAAGENSIAGIHPMLGGYDYLPVEMNARGKPLRDLSVEAFSILPYNFSRHGYQVTVVNPRGLGFTMAGDCSYLQMPGVNCAHIPQTVARRQAARLGFTLEELAESNYAALLELLGGVRGAPYALKEVLMRKGPWRQFLDHSAGTTFQEWADLRAFGEMSRFTSDRPNLNYISNILAHEPYYLGENCVPIHERLELSDEELLERGHQSLFSLQHAIAARCTLLLVGEYMQVLQAAGVYDNTSIVIASDHGIVGRVEDTSSRAVAGGTQGRDFVRTRSVLLVKPRGATGPLQVSETFLPNAEVPRIVCEEIGGCVNPYLGNRPIAARGRDDPFYVSLVPWQFSEQKPEAFVIKKQFALTGKDPFDVRGWQEVDRVSLR